MVGGKLSGVRDEKSHLLSFVYAPDVATAVTAALNRGGEGQVYHVACRENVTYPGYVEMVAR